MSVRTRFAPSPTGNLHVGSARTALYSWLFAKKYGGTFILRIEDTDQERSTQAAVDAILEGMTWLGLNWDEGPYYQTKHFERYKEVAEQLLEKGHAYRCYCSKERLEKLRLQQTENKEKPRYDGHCRAYAGEIKNEPYVIRFRNPDAGTVEIADCVKGKVVIQNSELDDLIICRTDGTPTYNFTVVVDDWDMKITHVIRGDDHLNNTPRQINILQALGATPPIYAHIPMILGADGKRLSKRHGAVSVQQYRAEGILPHALLNYLVRLGWSYGDQEIFSIEEMIEHFDIQGLNKSPAAFNAEKLLWLNQHYLKTGDVEQLAARFVPYLEKLGLDLTLGPSVVDVLQAQRERAKTFHEMAEKSIFFYKEVSLDEKAREKHVTQTAISQLKILREALAQMVEWKALYIHRVITETADALGVKMGNLAQPLRVAVTGNIISPSIDLTLELIGKERVLARLDKIIKDT